MGQSWRLFEAVLEAFGFQECSRGVPGIPRAKQGSKGLFVPRSFSFSGRLQNCHLLVCFLDSVYLLTCFRKFCQRPPHIFLRRCMMNCFSVSFQKGRVWCCSENNIDWYVLIVFCGDLVSVARKYTQITSHHFVLVRFVLLGAVGISLLHIPKHISFH